MILSVELKNMVDLNR